MKNVICFVDNTIEMDLKYHANESIGTWGTPRDMHEENYFY